MPAAAKPLPISKPFTALIESMALAQVRAQLVEDRLAQAGWYAARDQGDRSADAVAFRAAPSRWPWSSASLQWGPDSARRCRKRGRGPVPCAACRSGCSTPGPHSRITRIPAVDDQLSCDRSPDDTRPPSCARCSVLPRDDRAGRTSVPRCDRRGRDDRCPSTHRNPAVGHPYYG